MWVFMATAAELLYTKSQVRDIQDASYVCLSYHITSEGVYNNNNNKKVGEKEEKKIVNLNFPLRQRKTLPPPSCRFIDSISRRGAHDTTRCSDGSDGVKERQHRRRKKKGKIFLLLIYIYINRRRWVFMLCTHTYRKESSTWRLEKFAFQVCALEAAGGRGLFSVVCRLPLPLPSFLVCVYI